MREIKSNCSFCSLACPLIIRGGERGAVFTGQSLLSLDWDKSEGSKFGGSLCARGVAAVDYVNSVKRLNYPFVLGERSTFEAAVKETASNLSAVKKESGSESIGVLLGGGLTNEEATLAMRFTRDVLETDGIVLFAPDDVPIFRFHMGHDLSALGPAGPKPDGDREVSLLVGDSFSEHPCTAKIVLPGKRATRGSEVIVISPERNHTAWFADRHLQCRPAGEAAVAAGLLKAAVETGDVSLAKAPELDKMIRGIEWNAIERFGGVGKEALEGASSSLLGASKVRTYISNIFGRFGAPELTCLFTEAMTRVCPGETEFTPQFVQQNTWGVYAALSGAGGGKVFEKLERMELKAMMLLGLDLFSAFPAGPVEKAMRECKFAVSTQLFWNQTAARANVVIPAADLIEKSGTVWPEFGEELVRSDVLPPPGGAFTDGEFLAALAKEMGSDISPGGGKVSEPVRGGGDGRMEGGWKSFGELMSGLESADAVMIPWSEPAHAADGSLSRNLHWSMVTTPEPELMISDEMAEEAGIADGQRVSVESDGGKALLIARRTGKVEANTVGATIHFPAVRKLFPWKLDESSGEISLSPVSVKISGESEKS